MRPIFLHGMWRSGSTYLWSRFRAAPGTLCFYEPLHHGLAKLTAERIRRGTAAEVEANRHPVLADPYCLEYAPLIRRRGVRGYHASLASARHCLAPEARHPRLERYVRGLIDHAAAQGRTAVLGFNRTGGRVAWLRQRFAPFDIYIERDPAAVWGSYAACAAAGNATFFAMWLRVLEANRSDPVWAPLAERILPKPAPLGLAPRRRRHADLIAGMDASASYYLTHYAWRVVSDHARRHVDLVIDDALAASPAPRRQAVDLVAARTGVAIDLEDFRVVAPRMALDPAVKRRVEAEVAAVFPRQALWRLSRPLPAAARAPVRLGQGLGQRWAG